MIFSGKIPIVREGMVIGKRCVLWYGVLLHMISSLVFALGATCQRGASFKSMTKLGGSRLVQSNKQFFN